MAVHLADTAPRTARVFLSYKRNVESDGALADQVVAALSAAGHLIFIDKQLRVGQDWAAEIDRQVRQSDYLIVFLTAESILSEMVRAEIEIGRDQAAKTSAPHPAGAPAFRGAAAVPDQCVSRSHPAPSGPVRQTPAPAPRVARRDRRRRAVETGPARCAGRARGQPASAYGATAAGTVARARRHARRGRSVVSAAADRRHGAGSHTPVGPDAHDQGAAPDGQELSA